MYNLEPAIGDTTIAPQVFDQGLGFGPVFGMTAKECHDKLVFLI